MNTLVEQCRKVHLLSSRCQTIIKLLSSFINSDLFFFFFFIAEQTPSTPVLCSPWIINNSIIYSLQNNIIPETALQYHCNVLLVRQTKQKAYAFYIYSIQKTHHYYDVLLTERKIIIKTMVFCLLKERLSEKHHDCYLKTLFHYLILLTKPQLSSASKNMLSELSLIVL